MEEQQSTPFGRFGIEQDVDEQDKNLFHELKEIIYSYVTRNGHDYIPELGEFRASSMGKCSRKILLDKDIHRYLDASVIDTLPDWYQLELKGREEDIMEFGPHIAGQVIHEVLQEALKARIHSMEEEVGTEIQGARLKGHYDLLLEMDSGEQIVIDIKTTSAPRAYLPKEMHLRQLMAYQGMLGGIRGAILYVNRDTWEMSYVPQRFDKTVYSRLLVKLSTLYTSEQHKTLPPPQPEFDFECISTSHKCPFYDYCFPEIEQSNPDNS